MRRPASDWPGSGHGRGLEVEPCLEMNDGAPGQRRRVCIDAARIPSLPPPPSSSRRAESRLTRGRRRLGRKRPCRVRRVLFAYRGARPPRSVPRPLAAAAHPSLYALESQEPQTRRQPPRRARAAQRLHRLAPASLLSSPARLERHAAAAHLHAPPCMRLGARPARSHAPPAPPPPTPSQTRFTALFPRLFPPFAGMPRPPPPPRHRRGLMGRFASLSHAI